MVKVGAFEKRTGIKAGEIEEARVEIETAATRLKERRQEVRARTEELSKFRAGLLTRQQLQRLTLERKRTRDITLGKVARLQEQLVPISKQLTTTERAIGEARGQIQEVERLRNDFREARNLAFAIGVPFAEKGLKNEQQRRFFKEFKRQISRKKALATGEAVPFTVGLKRARDAIAKLQRDNPNETFIFRKDDPTQTDIIGIESGTLKASFASIEDYNKAIKQINLQRVNISPEEIRLKQDVPDLISNIKTGLKDVSEGFNIINQKVVENVTRPGLEAIKRTTGLSGQQLLEAVIGKPRVTVVPTEAPKAVQAFVKAQEKVGQFVRGVETGIIKGLIDEPLKIGVNLATFTVLPPALKLGGKIGRVTGITKILGTRAPAIISSLRKIPLDKALLTAYLGTTGLQIADQETAQARGELIGGKLVTEVAPFVIGSRIGTKIVISRELKAGLNKELARLSPEKRRLFQDYMKQTELFEQIKPKVTNIDFSGMKRIPEAARKPLTTFIKERNAIVGGSVAQRTQVKLDRIPNDVDLYLEVGSPEEAARALATRLKAAGVPRVSQVRGQVTIGGQKSVEFHSVERIFQNIAQVTPFWKPVRSYLVKTPEGITVQRIALQAKRKLVGGFTDPKRQKDLKDFKNIADRLFKEAEIAARQSFFFKEKRLVELEKRFGVKIPRQPKPIVPTTEKIIKKEVPILLRRKSPEGVIPGETLGAPGGRGPGKVPKKPFISQFKPKKIGKPLIPRPSQKPAIKPSQPPILRRISKGLGIPSQPPTKKPRAPPAFGLPEGPSQPPAPKLTPTPLIPLRVKIPEGPSQPPTPKPKLPGPPFVPSVPSGPVPPTRPPAKILRRFGASRLRPMGAPSKKQQGYDVFVRQKKKFLKANKVPITKLNAFDLGSFVTDRSLAATFKVQKAKGIAQKPKTQIPLLYFSRNQDKFRTFRKVKGTKIPITNTFIEKRKFRLDTSRETAKIQAAKLIAALRKPGQRRAPGLIFGK